jgi:hypothetical protein
MLCRTLDMLLHCLQFASCPGKAAAACLGGHEPNTHVKRSILCADVCD